ncbi:hypothetical protein TIFTF001_032767 [Ficus carica]|uniref:MBD domain-containing protein n=1 Tax=Ficus carica TaxID=3494 RepID=A0AA88J699_FICCA|nr:hypothetical protein TIFTF001_032767 [Ficus carica]
MEITGWEIVPYIPIDNKSKIAELDPTVLAQMFEILKKSVQKSAALLKEISTNEGDTTKDVVTEAVPISYLLPEGCDVQSTSMRIDKFIAEKSSSKPSNTKTRNATTLAGEVLVSFELPDDFSANGVDLDKLPLRREKGTSIEQNPRQYTFKQRLKGWKVKRKQRGDGRYDKYYYHFESNTEFRSAVEVVKFLLYEEYPKKQKTTPNKNTTPVEGSEEHKRPRSGKKTKKPSPVHSNSQTSGRSKPEESSTIRTAPATSTNVLVDDNPFMQYWQTHRTFEENYFAFAHNNFLNNPYTFQHWSSDTRGETTAEFEERWRMAENELRTSVNKLLSTEETKKRKGTENPNEEERSSTKIPKQARSKRFAIPMEAYHEGRGHEGKWEAVVKNVDLGMAEKTTASSPSRDLVSFGNFATQVEIDDISLEAAAGAENTVIHEHDRNLAVLSSIEDQRDLINYLPIDDIVDEVLPK